MNIGYGVCDSWTTDTQYTKYGIYRVPLMVYLEYVSYGPVHLMISIGGIIMYT
jgi:hypothetical protein